MRPRCFLLVVLTLVACCHDFANADGSAVAKNQAVNDNHKAPNGAVVRRHLKGSKFDLDEGDRGFTSIKTLLDRVPNKLKTTLQKDPSQAKTFRAENTELRGLIPRVGNSIKLSLADIRKFMKIEDPPAVGLMISVLKMLAVVGSVTVASGVIYYQLTK